MRESDDRLRDWLAGLPDDARPALEFLERAVRRAQRAGMGQPVAACRLVEGFLAALAAELDGRAHAGSAEGNGRHG